MNYKLLAFLIIGIYAVEYSEFMEQNKDDFTLKGLTIQVFKQNIGTFNSMDTNKDGSLSRTQFQANIKLIYPDLEEEDILMEVFQGYDIDADSEISLKDFMTQIIIQNFLSSEELMQEVKKIDANSDQTIDGKEFLNFFKKWNEEHPDRKYLENIKELDDGFAIAIEDMGPILFDLYNSNKGPDQQLFREDWQQGEDPEGNWFDEDDDYDQDEEGDLVEVEVGEQEDDFEEQEGEGEVEEEEGEGEYGEEEREQGEEQEEDFGEDENLEDLLEGEEIESEEEEQRGEIDL